MTQSSHREFDDADEFELSMSLTISLVGFDCCSSISIIVYDCSDELAPNSEMILFFFCSIFRSSPAVTTWTFLLLFLLFYPSKEIEKQRVRWSVINEYKSEMIFWD